MRILDPNIVTYSKARPLVEAKAEEIWKENTWNTAANVGRMIYYTDSQVAIAITEATTISYVSNWKRTNYGVPKVRRGLKGDCIKKFMVEEVDESGEIYYRELTEEEEAIKKELMDKYFKINKEEAYNFIELFFDGEIDANQCIASFGQFGYTSENFKMFRLEMSEKIGKVCNATMLCGGIYFGEVEI